MYMYKYLKQAPFPNNHPQTSSLFIKLRTFRNVFFIKKPIDNSITST